MDDRLEIPSLAVERLKWLQVDFLGICDWEPYQVNQVYIYINFVVLYEVKDQWLLFIELKKFKEMIETGRKH